MRMLWVVVTGLAVSACMSPEDTVTWKDDFEAAVRRGDQDVLALCGLLELIRDPASLGAIGRSLAFDSGLDLDAVDDLPLRAAEARSACPDVDPVEVLRPVLGRPPEDVCAGYRLFGTRALLRQVIRVAAEEEGIALSAGDEDRLAAFFDRYLAGECR